MSSDDLASMLTTTLTEYADVQQNTDEWIELRRGMVTASTIKSLVTAKTRQPASNIDQRSLLRTLVAERINGWPEENFATYDMMMGHVYEPIARDLYAKHFKRTVTTMGFMVREIGGLKLGYSPDALVGDDGLLEIKSRHGKEHVETVLAGEVPSVHMAQCQAGLFVSGREWIDFISYSPGMALYPVRVLPDPEWFDAIAKALIAFEMAASDMEAKYRANVVGLPMTKRATLTDEIEVPS